jgi:stearoyl-CoA desaturase (Delta-9 desaturase)
MFLSNPAISSPLPTAQGPLNSFFRYVLKNFNKGPFLAIHLAVLAVFFVPLTWPALGLCVLFYIARMFGITGGFHRYFAHRAYKTSRFFQFCLGVLGSSALQKGPLWWAANHRMHHKHSDQENDPHSPIRHGVWWSHVGWVLSAQNQDDVDLNEIKDFAKYPELRWLETLHFVPAFLLAGLCYVLGEFAFGGQGWSCLVWGFIVSTVLLYHGTFLVNSACHVFGRRRYHTTDHSKNNWWVAILTLGEGWHNNHHFYMSSARQGFRWWEVDVSYYILKFLAVPRVVWDLRGVPAKKLANTIANSIVGPSANASLAK